MTPRVFQACALRLLENGYSPVPLRPLSKKPLLKKWNELRENTLSPESIDKIATKNPGLGLAVAGGWNGLIPIDIDASDPAVRDAICKVLPAPVVAKAGRRGFTLFYHDPTGKIGGRKFATKTEMLVEVLATGHATIPPTVHPETKQQYRWLRERTMWDTLVGNLPVIDAEHIADLEAVVRPWLPAPKEYVPPPPQTRTPTSDKRQAAYAHAVLDDKARMLAAMAAESGRNNALFCAVCILGKYVHHGVLPEAEMRAALIGACQANGSVRDHSLRQCHDTIASGLKKSLHDPLRQLADSRRPSTP